MPISTIDNSGISASAAISTSKLGAGAVLQVVQTVKTDTFVSSATVTDTAVTGLTVSITPSSASSKILIICNLSVGAENQQGAAAKLTRGGTAISAFLADAAGSRSRSSFAGSAYRGAGTAYTLITLNTNLTALDSPATTSSITYGVVVSSLSNGTYINRSQSDSDQADCWRGVSYITAMEIAA